MGKAQIAVKMPSFQMEKLNCYVQHTGTSKTDGVVSAIAPYFGCAENVPLTKIMAELERRVAVVETKIEAK